MEPRKPREGGTAAARCSYANRLASKADNATASARNISALTTSWPQQQKRRRKQFPASSSHDNSRSESPHGGVRTPPGAIVPYLPSSR